MYAIARRAYKEAVAIFQRVKQLVEDSGSTEGDHAQLMEYLYPSNSPLDHNPLYVLCCNDTCSFTWTKDRHIQLRVDILLLRFKKVNLFANLPRSLFSLTSRLQAIRGNHEKLL